MGRPIIKIKDRYFIWSTIVDAPISRGMTRKELEVEIMRTRGAEGLKELPARLARVEACGTSAQHANLRSLISHNRAGPDESHLSAEEIYQRYQ
ncbi:hypothetical protein DB346_08645 [Verrucomicrobia bacterium LW23]|nr:hypothetical protein DB346_08645 [Verrucomicrobia bacterium LW23]